MNDSPSTSIVVLPSSLRISEAEALRDQLLSHLEDVDTLDLDGSAIQEVDTAGLQLLAAFFSDRRKLGRVARWLNPSKSLVQTADLLGLHHWLELPDPA